MIRAMLLAGLVLVTGAQAADRPDLERALAYRDLAPVRAWLAGLDASASSTAPAWRARIAIARVDRAVDVSDLLVRALAEHPDDPGLRLQQAAVALADLDEDGGRFERMREARAIGRQLDEALERGPELPQALAAAIGFHRDVPRIAGGREERVEPLMARLVAVDPARAAHLRAGVAMRDDRLEEAAAALDTAIAFDRLSRPAWNVERAALTGRQGGARAAVEALEAITAAHPDFAPAWFELGRWIAAAEGPPESGIAALERYLLMPRWPGDPPLADALIHLATLKDRAGDEEGARRAREQARILAPSRTDDEGP